MCNDATVIIQQTTDLYTIVINNDCQDITIQLTEAVPNTTIELCGLGQQGLSAYQIALGNGFVGTEAEWLESLLNTEYVDNQLLLKVDKVTGYSLTKNDLTDALKALYDGAVNWIYTNGNNLLSHLTNYSNPHQVTASQVGAYTTSQVDLLLPTKTSDLTNDGEDGVHKFISLLDLPSNLILYATNATSDISTYYKLVTDIHDADFNSTAVNISTGSISTTSQLIASLATTTNVITGNPGIFNITTIGNITKIAGSGEAEFFFRVYKRTSAGVETMIAQSSNTIPVINSGYSEFSATALWDDGLFLGTDRIVLKFYASRISGGSNPTYQFQFGGISPVRTLVPIPLSTVPVSALLLNTNGFGEDVSIDYETYTLTIDKFNWMDLARGYNEIPTIFSTTSTGTIYTYIFTTQTLYRYIANDNSEDAFYNEPTLVNRLCTKKITL